MTHPIENGLSVSNGNGVPLLTAGNFYAKAAPSLKVVTALAQAKQEMGPLVKNATNPHFKNKYATLEQVLNVIEGPLENAGLFVYQETTGYAQGNLYLAAVTTYLVHLESGEFISHTLPLPVAKNDPQAAGSAITYGRRYSLTTLCGLVPEDDDGNAGSGHDRQSRNASQNGNGQNGSGRQADPSVSNPSNSGQVTAFTALTKQVYGSKAGSEAKRLCKYISKNRTDDPQKLSFNEINDLIVGLQTKVDDAKAQAASQRAASGNAEPMTFPEWKTPIHAQEWGVEQGYIADMNEAKALWREMVTDHFGGRLTSDDIPNALQMYGELLVAES